MTVTVISQSMYFPWIGLFDQIRLADEFIFYDDVQLTRGFYNRVQVAQANGTKFITVPLAKKTQKQLIQDTEISQNECWHSSHKSKLEESFSAAPYNKEALKIFDKVMEKNDKNLADLNKNSIMEIAKNLSLENSTNFKSSSEMLAIGTSSERLLDLCKKSGCDIYLTGHGALNYLDHNLFERNSIEVFYIKYEFTPYETSFRDYTPYVTCLDAIAHLGTKTVETMKSKMVHWSDAILNPESLRPFSDTS